MDFRWLRKDRYSCFYSTAPERELVCFYYDSGTNWILYGRGIGRVNINYIEDVYDYASNFVQGLHDSTRVLLIGFYTATEAAFNKLIEDDERAKELGIL
jgi:hypothetical protein